MLFILYKIYLKNFYLAENSLYKNPLFLRETARGPAWLINHIHILQIWQVHHSLILHVFTLKYLDTGRPKQTLKKNILEAAEHCIWSVSTLFGIQSFCISETRQQVPVIKLLILKLGQVRSVDKV